ncbi:ketopantoate reductase [Arthrobacter sp. UYEF20]
MEAGGETYIRDAIAETEGVAGAAGDPIRPTGHEQSVQILIAPGSSFTSSLYRDLKKGRAVEAEHILGTLAVRADAPNVAVPLLKLALVQIRAHHVRVR